MNYNTIMAVKLKKRSDLAAEIQEILTDHGCIIAARMGLHEIENGCRQDGLITLFLDGSQERIDDLKNNLNAYKNVRAKTLSLEF